MDFPGQGPRTLLLIPEGAIDKVHPCRYPNQASKTGVSCRNYTRFEHSSGSILPREKPEFRHLGKIISTRRHSSVRLHRHAGGGRVGDFVSARRTLGLAFLGAGTALAVKGFDYHDQADAFYADYQQAVDPIEINRLYQRTTNRDIKAQVSWALGAACGIGGLRLLATGVDKGGGRGESETSPAAGAYRNQGAPKPRLLKLKTRLDPLRRQFRTGDFKAVFLIAPGPRSPFRLVPPDIDPLSFIKPDHPMTGRRICLIASVAVALTGTSCDRERSNPLDPQGDFARKRPSTPAGLAAEPGVGVVRLSWQGVEDRDLAGYAVLRSEDAAGEFTFLHGRGPSGATITTGKTSYVDSLHAFVGKTFFYRVAAVDTSGLQSEPSGFVGATVLEDKVAPEPPRSLAAIPDETEPRITLVWTPPVRDAGGGELSGLAGYAILRGELGTGGAVPVDTVDAETRLYVDDGLKPLTSYSYALVAFDGAGNTSSLSQIVQVTTPGMPVPADVVAESGIGRIEVSWEAVGDEELLGYDVYRSERPDESFARLPGVEGTPFTTGRTSYVDTSVQVGRAYYYKVQSVGRTHRSELSSQVGAEALADEASPGVPRNVSAVAEAGFTDRITVRWSAPTTDADGGELTGLSGFTVYRSEGVSGSLVAVATLGAEVREYVDEGLRSLTEYGYAVSAFDGGGNESVQSAVSRARTEGIAVPSGVRAADGIGRIELSWEAVGDEELIGYNVYRSSRPDLEFERLESSSGASYTTARTSYVDSHLTAGVRYYYKVSSVSSGFESELSGYVSGESQADVLAPEPPGGLVATALEAGSGIRLSWRAPRYDADGGELTGLSGYVIFRSSSGLSERVAVDTVSSSVTEYVDEDLESGVVYTYALMAVDGSGNGSELTGPVSATSRGLAPPSGVSAESGIGRITVSWLGSDESDLVGYNVYRSPRSDGDFARSAGSGGHAVHDGPHELRGHERSGGSGVLLQGSVGGSDPPFGAVGVRGRGGSG